ncbi:MAG: NFACT family protein [Spirochaetales bacterium]|nr:NFACT family protein [Spirochaetales bacterium]
MSLNWREIDRVLEEIPLEGALVQEVRQPKPPQLILELFNRGSSFRLFFCFATPHQRLHLLSRKPPGGGTPQRFVSFLRAHVRGGRIVAASQLARERIVRLEVRKAERTVVLWARLWGGAANLIATDPQGTILDALYRRPRRREISGGSYRPESELAPGDPKTLERHTLREFPGPGSYNQRVEAHYRSLEEQEERVRLQATVLRRLERQENRLLAAVQTLESRRAGYARLEEYKLCGELILAHLHELEPGDRWLEAEDFGDPGQSLAVELDPRLSPSANAESYFRRYRKAKAGLRLLEEEDRQLRRQLEELSALRREIEAEPPLHLLREEARRGVTKKGKAAEEKEGPPGLLFRSGPFTILVGRTAQENDELLRHHVKGNDTWLHARDFPGSYVFVRALPGKSVPLDTLLDAGNLAVLYSKGRGSARGDVYYTQVKYLRRAKGGKTGTVLPTHEKNLQVVLDPARLRRLKAQPEGQQ